MLGADNATPAIVPLKCKAWELQGDSDQCHFNIWSLYAAPATLLGVPVSNMTHVVSVAVWGGLAYLLFMRGR